MPGDHLVKQTTSSTTQSSNTKNSEKKLPPKAPVKLTTKPKFSHSGMQAGYERGLRERAALSKVPPPPPKAESIKPEKTISNSSNYLTQLYPLSNPMKLDGKPIPPLSSPPLMGNKTIPWQYSPNNPDAACPPAGMNMDVPSDPPPKGFKPRPRFVFPPSV